MKIEVWTHEWKDENGYPKTLITYDSDIIPQINSWIALGKGPGAHPTWRVVKIVHIVELEKVSIQVTGS